LIFSTLVVELRSEEEVEMVGHYNEFMKCVGFAVAIVKESFYQDFNILGDLEDGAGLPALCGDEVGGAWGGSVLGVDIEQAFFSG